MQDTFYSSLPKVELHRHLEGSLRLETMADIIRQYDLDLPVDDLARLKPLVQILQGEPATHSNFLSKFKVLRHFFRSPEVIRRITREAIADASADNVRYLELRFTPVALSNRQDFALSDVMDWVAESAVEASRDFGIQTRLIASANRHESPDLAAEVVGLAAEKRHKGFVAVDLAGDEANFPAAPFATIYRQAKESGLGVTIHAGEWAGADNVGEAVEEMQADRIGHGVRIMEDPATVNLARARGVIFEVCPTSNLQSGVVPTMADHPMRDMLAAGLEVTINTDDPGISRIVLSDEYRLACTTLGLQVAELQACVIRAARAAFIQPAERSLLEQELTASPQE